MESYIPNSLEDVERLVQELYQPGPPQKIANIQETLQQLQRSVNGWRLGDSLLNSSDEKSKFFGALTFTVKLNSDGDSINTENALEILQQLTTHLIQSLSDGVGALVIRKLCSTLVVYFLRFSPLWPRCVRHLICSLGSDKFIPIEALDSAPRVTTMIEILTSEKALAVLWFSSTLAEEVGKTDANNIKAYQFHQRLEENVSDVVPLISSTLAEKSDSKIAVKLRQEAMKTFQSWVFYSHRAFIDSGTIFEPLKTLTKPAITCLLDDTMYGVTVELFSDILANYSRFLDEGDFRLLFSLFDSDWARLRYNRLVQGGFSFDSLQFGNLMLAFGDATVQDLARKEDPASQQFLMALGMLLAADGYAVAEDQIFVPAVEFWSTYVEVLVDSLYTDQPGVSSDPGTHKPEVTLQPLEESDTASRRDEPWFSTGLSHVSKVIQNCWRKIQYPPPDEFDSWDTVDQTGFNMARMDVIDLLQASYSLIGIELCSMFAMMALQSLEKGAWAGLEASLYCLCGFSDDCHPDEPTSESILAGIFDSALFTVLAKTLDKSALRARKAALKLIGEYDWFFKQRNVFLPEALNFLFKTLLSPELATTAAKSIQSLCSSCREPLISEIGAFLHHYEELNLYPGFHGIVQEKVIAAIAAIIQALPTEVEKEKHLMQLLRFIDDDVRHSSKLLADGRGDDAEARGLEVLRCLTCIAKGLQAPPDIIVDLTDSQSRLHSSEYWVKEPGSDFQIHMQTIMKSLLTAFPDSGGMVEGVCSIFRAGFAEKSHGPCVFSPHVVAEFLLGYNYHAPALGTVISTASALVSSHIVESSSEMEDVLHRLCLWLLDIFQALQEPGDDPELAQAGIEFLHRLLLDHTRSFTQQTPRTLEFLFVFTLKALDGKDPLPKSAAADFWAAFISLQKIRHHSDEAIKSTMQHFGPRLAETLIYNFGGNASRSELDKLCDPLKKLVAQQIESKAWLENALFGKTFIDDRVSGPERKIFLQKIINLRGAKQTNQIVRDFWLMCRGSNFAYTS